MPLITSDIVEICVFKNTAAEPHYLILKRSADDSLYPGIWQIVTGVIAQNEHAAVAALREVEEETGLSPVRFWRIPGVNSFYESERDAIHLCPNFAAEVPDDAEPILSAEHSGHEWCTFDRARSLLPWSGQRASLQFVHTYIRAGTEESRLLEISIEELERKQH